MPDNFENGIFDEIEQVFEKEDRHTRIIVVLSIVIVIAVIVAIILGISYYKEHNKVIYTSAEIANLEEENEAIIKAKDRSPVPVSDNRFYFKDGLLGETWLPVIEGVPQNTLDGMSFETDEKGRRKISIALIIRLPLLFL